MEAVRLVKKAAPAKAPKVVVIDDGSDPLPEGQSADSLDAIFAEIEGDNDAYIVLYRLGDDKRLYRLDRFAPAEFVLDDIPKRYGGGTYRIVARNKGDYMKSSEVRFDPRLKGELDKSPAAAAPEKPAEDNFTKLLLLMREDQKANQAFMLQLVEKMVGQKPAEKSFFEQMKEFAELKKLLGPDNALKFSDYRDMLREAADMFGEARSSENPMDNILNTVTNLLIKAATAPRPAAPAAPAPAPRPALPAAGAPLEVHSPGGPAVSFDLKQVEPIMQLLTNAAVANKPVEGYAQIIIDATPAGQHDALVEFLKTPDWFEKFSTAFPKIQALGGWFKRLGAVIVGAFEEAAPAPEAAAK